MFIISDGMPGTAAINELSVRSDEDSQHARGHLLGSAGWRDQTTQPLHSTISSRGPSSNERHSHRSVGVRAGQVRGHSSDRNIPPRR